jgi:energy-coupling factor transporter ATP-binding protein EcfA2
MFQSVFGVFTSIFMAIFKFLIIAIAIILVPLFLSMAICYLVHIIKGDRIKKRTVPLPEPVYTKKRSVIIRLFVDFPKRFIQDKFDRNPDAFNFHGVHVFAGEQGSGKSIAMVHFALMLKEQYPACRVCSNIDLNFQDEKIEDWHTLVDKNNGELGQICILDELQNWFSSMDSKNFPPEMLQDITQERKQRKAILGTSQVFTRLAKPIREQVTLLYLPKTFFGCITFVRVYKCDLNDDGTLKDKHCIKMYFFVHDDRLRNAYDTYERVARLSVKGFQPRSEQLSNDTMQQNVNIFNKR